MMPQQYYISQWFTANLNYVCISKFRLRHFCNVNHITSHMSGFSCAKYSHAMYEIFVLLQLYLVRLLRYGRTFAVDFISKCLKPLEMSTYIASFFFKRTTVLTWSSKVAVMVVPILLQMLLKGLFHLSRQ